MSGKLKTKNTIPYQFPADFPAVPEVHGIGTRKGVDNAANFKEARTKGVSCPMPEEFRRRTTLPPSPRRSSHPSGSRPQTWIGSYWLEAEKVFRFWSASP